jgi:predicted O-methyltransferase YrrM
VETPGFTITLDYAPSQSNEPRWGYGRPSHARLASLLGRHGDRYARELGGVARHIRDLRAIAVTLDEAGPGQPAWINGFLPGLDGALLYGLLREHRPARYLEIGSGHSTKFVARARRDGGLQTRLISIDPAPRAEIDELCDEVIRAPLEAVDLAMFGRLRRGDTVFFDGSHRVFMNGDTVAFFLDILPILPAGVLVGVHDIRLPDDYPAEFAERWYSEQYLLACWLLAESPRVQPVVPAAYVTRHTSLAAVLDPLWTAPSFEAVERHGDAFWFLTDGAADGRAGRLRRYLRGGRKRH